LGPEQHRVSQAVSMIPESPIHSLTKWNRSFGGPRGRAPRAP
jgi:hypothetical protein